MKNFRLENDVRRISPNYDSTKGIPVETIYFPILFEIFQNILFVFLNPIEILNFALIFRTDEKCLNFCKIIKKYQVK